MPRVSKVEMCMFCGQVPCICNAPAPKPARAKASPKPAMEPSLKPGFEVKPEAFEPPAIKRGPFSMMSPTQQLQAMVETPTDGASPVKERTDSEVHADALKVILDARILRPDEQVRIGKMLTSTRDPMLDTRVNEWKRARRG